MILFNWKIIKLINNHCNLSLAMISSDLIYELDNSHYTILTLLDIYASILLDTQSYYAHSTTIVHLYQGNCT